MQTRTSGGTSETEQTAVAVSPRGCPWRSVVVTTVTPAASDPITMTHDLLAWWGSGYVRVWDLSVGEFGDCTSYYYWFQLQCADVGIWHLNWSANGWETQHEDLEPNYECPTLQWSQTTILADPVHEWVQSQTTLQINQT